MKTEEEEEEEEEKKNYIKHQSRVNFLTAAQSQNAIFESMLSSVLCLENCRPELS